MSNESYRVSEVVSRLFRLRRSEYSEVAYCLILFLIVGFALSLSRVISDVLFFSRFGVHSLPIIYILIGVMTVPVIYSYSWYLGRSFPERLLLRLTALLATTNIILWFILVVTKSNYVYPFYYVFNELISSLLLVHIFHYIKQRVGRDREQRILPVLLIGLPFGSVVGGVLLMLLVPLFGIEHFILVVALSMCLLFLLVWFHHSQSNHPEYMSNKEAFSSPVAVSDELKKGLLFAKHSTLFKMLLMGVVAAIVSTYLLNYLLAGFYVQQFTDEQSLARFFAWLVALTSSIIFFVQVVSASHLSTPLGLRFVNLKPAITLIGSFLLLSISFNLVVAILSSIIKDLSNIVVRTPSYHPFFQAIPATMKGRCRLVMRIVAIPIGMVLSGVCLLFLHYSQPLSVILGLGLVASLLYLWANIRSNRAFYDTLLSRAQDLQFAGHALFYRFKPREHSMIKRLLRGMESDIQFVVIENAQRILFWFPKQGKQHILERLSGYPQKTQLKLLALLVKHECDYPSNEVSRGLVNNHLWNVYRQLDDKYEQCSVLHLLYRNKDQLANHAGEHLEDVDYPCKESLDLQTLIEKYFTAKEQGDAGEKAQFEVITERLSSMMQSQNQDKVGEALLVASSRPNLCLPVDSILPALASSDEKQRYAALCLIEPSKQLLPEHIYAFYGLLNDVSQRVQLKAIKVVSRINHPKACDYLFDALENVMRSDVRSEALKQWLIKGGDKSHNLYDYILHNKGSFKVQKTLMKKGRETFSTQDLILLIESKLKAATELQAIIMGYTCLYSVEQQRFSKVLELNDNHSPSLAVETYTRYAHQRIHDQFAELPLKEQYKLIILNERLLQLTLLVLMGLYHLDNTHAVKTLLAILRSQDNVYDGRVTEALATMRYKRYIKPLHSLINTLIRSITLESKKTRVEDHASLEAKLLDWCKTGADDWTRTFLCREPENDMLDLIDRITLLKKMDIFNEIYTEDLKIFAEALEEDYLMAGDYVFKKGDPSEACYLIAQGEIGMSVDIKIDETGPLVTLKAGGYFGEMGVLDGHPRAATAYVLEDARLLCISRTRFLSIIQYHPEIAVSILSRMNSIIREQNQQLYND